MNSPATPETQTLHAWIDTHADQIIAALQGALRIPSVKADPAPNAPFGQPVRDALDYTLNLCKDLGFQVKDVDGYAGHAEFGEGAEYVGALGHLDVVPEGDYWQHPPYGAELDEGFIYARGTSDDKGPTYAALFAAKALMDSGLPLSRRVRVIFGCDEESGFGCVKHYFEVANEERPAMGFTPDACFPLVYAEKGIVNLIFEKPRPHFEHAESEIWIKEVKGGRRPNMVPDHAEATLGGSPDALAAAAEQLEDYWDQNVSAKLDGDTVTVTALGKSAHGSQPMDGDNAVARLARALMRLDLPHDDGWLEWVVETADPFGQGLGIKHADEIVGQLTSNLGILEADEEKIRLTYNIRYPVRWTVDALIDANHSTRDNEGWELVEWHDQAPLYIHTNQEPSATLLRVYQECTGDYDTHPMTMGGGTYARATPNVVAFGAGFPEGEDGPAHEPEERIAVSTLLNAAKIYAQALYELAR